jgi:hypothetical protein
LWRWREGSRWRRIVSWDWVGRQGRGWCLQETIDYAADNDDAAEPDVNGCHLRGLFGLFVDAMVHDAEDELDEHR